MQILVVLLLLLLIGPFLIPVPPLEGLRPARELADADSQFITLNGLDVHLKSQGQGDAPVFVLLHGFGASLYSWDAVMQSLSKLGRVIAFDRPGFGLTERPLRWKSPNPYSPEAQVALLIRLLDHFGIKQAYLVGNSAGGLIAMQATLAHPERVAGLILVDPAVYRVGGAPAWVRPLLSSPQMRHLGPLVSRKFQTRGMDMLKTAWHDPQRISPEVLALYQKPLQVENWDKAFWEFSLASRASDMERHLDRLNLPALVISGEDDRIIPTQESIRLAQELPDAQLVLIPDAGHVPHEEQPLAFIAAVENFIKNRATPQPPSL